MRQLPSLNSFHNKMHGKQGKLLTAHVLCDITHFTTWTMTLCERLKRDGFLENCCKNRCRWAQVNCAYPHPGTSRPPARCLKDQLEGHQGTSNKASPMELCLILDVHFQRSKVSGVARVTQSQSVSHQA